MPTPDYNSCRDSPPRREFFISIIFAHHTVCIQLNHTQALALVGELILHTLGWVGLILLLWLLRRRGLFLSGYIRRGR